MKTQPHPTCYALGYRRGGTYACSCGQIIGQTNGGAIPAEAAPAIGALKDQWSAHRRDKETRS